MIGENCGLRAPSDFQARLPGRNGAARKSFEMLLTWYCGNAVAVRELSRGDVWCKIALLLFDGGEFANEGWEENADFSLLTGQN